MVFPPSKGECEVSEKRLAVLRARDWWRYIPKYENEENVYLTFCNVTSSFLFQTKWLGKMRVCVVWLLVCRCVCLCLYGCSWYKSCEQIYHSEQLSYFICTKNKNGGKLINIINNKQLNPVPSKLKLKLKLPSWAFSSSQKLFSGHNMLFLVNTQQCLTNLFDFLCLLLYVSLSLYKVFHLFFRTRYWTELDAVQFALIVSWLHHMTSQLWILTE